jgi:diguanylate cyclase (GGDEF)-like protein
VRSGAGIRRWLGWVIVGDGFGCLAIVAIVVGAIDYLPPVVHSGTFTAFFVTILAPLVVGVNIIAAVAILSSQRPSRLQLWLSVALVISAMDGLLNVFSSGRYTITWYVGKVETLATATVVLVILLSEVSSLYRRLGGLASIDFLTGISNRQAFNNDARIALLLQQRRSEDVGFLVVDIDYFKQFNDTYGHQAGDVCLHQVAQCIRRACARAVDLVGRFGGEEFVVLLQGTNAAGALRVGEQIRRCVEALEIVHGTSTVAAVVTVSVGVTHASGERETTLEVLFQRADAALYEAKKSRNAVAVHDAQPDVAPLIAEPA